MPYRKDPDRQGSTPTHRVLGILTLLASVTAPTPCLSEKSPQIVITNVSYNSRPSDPYPICVNTAIVYDRETTVGIPPCPLTMCHYGIYLQTNFTNHWDVGTNKLNNATIEAPPGLSWAQLRYKYSEHANTYSLCTTPPPNAKKMRVCVGLNPHPYENVMGSIILENTNDCADVPARTVTCSVDSVNLDHGVLSADQVNGHTTTSLLGLSCSGPATLRISMATERINLGDGIKSRVTVNGVSGGAIVSSEGPIVITSQLSSSGPVEGPHSGSGVIILSIE